MTDHGQLDLSQGLKKAMVDELPVIEVWRRESAVAIHPGLASDMSYDKQKATWRSPSSHKLEEVLSRSRLGDVKIDIQDSSWDDVLDYIGDYVENAKSAYESKASSNKPRKILRKGEPAAKILDRLAAMIPDQNGLSVLRGGLSYIFQAWGKALHNRSAILDALEDIPTLFVTALQDLDLYSDAKLLSLIRELYETLLNTLPTLVGILNRKYHDTNFWKKLIKQEPEFEGQTIDNIVGQIEKAKRNYFDRVAHLDRATTKETKRIVQDSERDIKATLDAVWKGNNATKKIQTSLDDFKSDSTVVHQKLLSSVHNVGEEVLKEMVDIKEQMKQQKEELERLAGTQVSTEVEKLMGLFHMLFADNQLTRSTEPPPRPLTPEPRFNNLQRFYTAPELNQFSGFLQPSGFYQPPIFTSRHALVNISELLGILNAPGTLRDAETILRQGNNIRPDALGRARWLLVTPQFKNWISGAPSTLLLVDGFSKDHGKGQTSPVSVLCASLSSMLVKSKAGIVLQFFCAHHADPQDPPVGPKGLLRGIITQLILFPKEFNLVLDTIDAQRVNGLRAFDIHSLCFLFDYILRQIPPTRTVYLIIDGISSFESGLYGYDKEMDIVFDMLRILVHSTGFCGVGVNGPRFKLLMTTANKSLRLSQRSDIDREREYVSLRTGNINNRPISSSALQSSLQPALWDGSRSMTQ